MIKIVTLALITLTLCGAQTLEVSAKQQSDLGIKTQKVIQIDNIALSPYNGVVVLNKRDIISINSNIESIVEEIYVSNFAKVKKGEKLLKLKSNALLSIQRDYIESLIQSSSASANYKRDMKLHAEGIISKKRLLESKKLQSSAYVSVKLNANQLLTNGFSEAMLSRLRATNKPIVEQDIYAPKDGVIYTIDVNIGEYVQADKMMLGIYADGARYIDISVPVKMIQSISLGDRCEFSNYSAKVVAIGSVVDVASQSVEVRAQIETTEGLMINRVYGVKIHKEVKESVKIKKSALVFVDASSFVFKKVSSGFEVVNVEIVSEGPVCYVVKGAINADDFLAVSSTAALLGAMEEGDE